MHGVSDLQGLEFQVELMDVQQLNDRLLAGLRGHVLEIPVTGTFDRPRLDSSALGKLTTKAVTGAAEGLLKNELEKQLQRLFK